MKSINLSVVKALELFDFESYAIYLAAKPYRIKSTTLRFHCHRSVSWMHFTAVG